MLRLPLFRPTAALRGALQARWCAAAGGSVGYHKLPPSFALPPACVEVKLARGSGPGGQGVNSSSNKAELRVDLKKLQMLSDAVDGETLDRLRVAEAARVTTGDVLIYTSHEHRSALKNQEACAARARRALHAASYVAPVAAPIDFERRFDASAVRKRMDGAGKRKQRASARRSNTLSGSSW
jgi:protein subunit release factor B